MDHVEVVQGTDAWLKARAGKVTASRVADVLAKGKNGGESVTRRNYMAKLAVETLTGEPVVDDYKNGHMERGNELEASAREAYEFVTGHTVEQVGLVDHATIPRYAASPDGLVGADGLIEIKSPIPAIHIGYLLSGEVPAEYQKQMQSQMDCTGRTWNDFVSYCPVMPIDLQLFVCRLHRDDNRIAEMRVAVTSFLAEVDDMVAKLKGIAG